jgi:ATP-dependent exoDNAse (exonuclease V) alpha subunit
LPFGPIPPNDKRFEIDEDKPTKSGIFKELKIGYKKKKILKQMKLLIIDEISMVRADVIDAIDKIMKAVTGKINQPFGGKQILMIGDNFQLPPVSKPDEDEILGPHYRSPFFFDSHVFYNYPPAVIELKKIYRQHDEHFINILNQVRNSSITIPQLNELNEKYAPSFEPKDDEPYILISTHNQTVDKVNKSKLASIDADMKGFEGVLDGDFDGRRLPTHKTLNLKIGAQVMFLRNDLEKERRYYNGSNCSET